MVSGNDFEGDFDELRDVFLRYLLITVFVLGTLPLWYVAAETDRVNGLKPLLPSALLLLTWVLTLQSHRFKPKGRLGAATLVVGLFASDIMTIHVLPFGIVSLGFGPIVAIATVLLDPWWGLATVLFSNSIIIFALPIAGVTSSPTVAVLLIASVWGSFVLAWIFWQPVNTALYWAWRTCAQCVAITEQLRNHQVELSRVNRSLNEAYSRLEQLSTELDVARRNAEEDRRRKVEFATCISHELRTPLNLIIGFSEMMLMSPRARVMARALDTYRGDVEAIYRNACHLSSLIDDVLDLSQIDAHRMGLKRELVPLTEVVDEATTAVTVMFQDKGLNLTVDAPPETEILYFDRIRIRQVLINLLSNAARFTIRGGVTIQYQSNERDVIVSVHDTGPGISAEYIPSVFEEYHQFDAMGSRRHNGLGLAICKRFVELHGGNIWVESLPDNGTTFSFSLPRVHSVAAVPFEPDWGMLARAARSEPRAPAIAVIGTDAEGLKAFRRYLDGYEVVKVTNGKNLLELAEGHSIQAIVVASTNPTCWHDFLTRSEISADHDYLRNLPLITCALHTIHDVATELGVVDYLRKPVTREQIRDSLDQIGQPIHHILVAEDDNDMAQLIEFMIRADFPQCQVVRAQSGREAIDLLKQRRPDVVLLDLLMPDGNGYTVLDSMRGDKSLSDVPVVVVSAKGEETELVVANMLQIGRPDGLTVGEVMVCLQRSLDWLLRRLPQSADRVPPAVPAGRLV